MVLASVTVRGVSLGGFYILCPVVQMFTFTVHPFFRVPFERWRVCRNANVGAHVDVLDVAHRIQRHRRNDHV